MSEEKCSFENEDLFMVWHSERNSSKKIGAVSNFILNALRVSGTDISEQFKHSIEEKIRMFCITLSSRWKDSHRTLKTFKTKNGKWLKEHFILQKPGNEVSETATAKGRPPVPYEQKSTRSQRREASELSQSIDQNLDLLVHATAIAARRKGKKDLAATLDKTIKSPKQSETISKALSYTKPIPFSVDEAVAFFYDNNLSKRQYINIRLENKKRNCDIYPTYNTLLEAKENCRPFGIVADETSARVPLQNLLEHTVQRILLTQKQVINNVILKTDSNIINIEMICSYGFDGSSGHSIYKQKFEQASAGSDSFLFATTLIPLRLVTNDIILWNNTVPQSIRFCRPLKIEYIKETREIILREQENLNTEINNLSNVEILQENKMLNITFKMVMTLIDGKVLNTITGTKSTQCCPICGATPTQVLNISDFQSKQFEPKRTENLQYGVSSLHAWIRFFECVLQIAYRIPIAKWQIRQEDDKLKLRSRKKEIQRLFWERYGLHIDKPKIGGSGNTNDGNTARRSFQQIEKLADSTGVDINLLKNLKIILITISCQYPINFEKFETFCFDTARLFMEKYPWYPMSPTIHKILIHGKQILQNSILPPGYLGEDAAESRNKFYKQDRLFHSRKESRKNNILDVFHRALDTSDPFISSISLTNRIQKQQLNKQKLPTEVISLVSCPIAPTEPSEPQSSTSHFSRTDDSDSNDDNESDNEEYDLPIFEYLDNVELELDVQ